MVLAAGEPGTELGVQGLQVPRQRVLPGPDVLGVLRQPLGELLGDSRRDQAEPLRIEPHVGVRAVGVVGVLVVGAVLRAPALLGVPGLVAVLVILGVRMLTRHQLDHVGDVQGVAAPLDHFVDRRLEATRVQHQLCLLDRDDLPAVSSRSCGSPPGFVRFSTSATFPAMRSAMNSYAQTPASTVWRSAVPAATESPIEGVPHAAAVTVSRATPHVVAVVRPAAGAVSRPAAVVVVAARPARA